MSGRKSDGSQFPPLLSRLPFRAAGPRSGVANGKLFSRNYGVFGCGVGVLAIVRGRLGLFHLLRIKNTILTGSMVVLESLTDAQGVPVPVSYVLGVDLSRNSSLALPVGFSDEQLADSMWFRFVNWIYTELSHPMEYGPLGIVASLRRIVFGLSATYSMTIQFVLIKISPPMLHWPFKTPIPSWTFFDQRSLKSYPCLGFIWQLPLRP